MFRSFRTVVLTALLVMSACSGDDVRSAPTSSIAATTSEPTTVVVAIESSRFSRPDLDLRVGDTVRFEQRDPYAHTVTEAGDEPTFDSGELLQGDTFEITFDEPGTYDYLCLIHPTMRGAVTVT